MSNIIHANCPRCNKPLRIPTEWIGKGMKCKHCRGVFRAKTRSGIPAQSANIQASQPLAGIAQASSPPARDSSLVSESPAVAPAPHPFPTEVPAAVPTATNGPATSKASGRGSWDFHGSAPEKSRPKKRSSYRRGGSNLPKIVIGLTMVILTTVGLVFLWPQIQQVLDSQTKSIDPSKTTLAEAEDGPSDSKKTTKQKGPNGSATSVRFPRRLLAISVNDYLLANPLTYGSRREAGFPGSSPAALKTILNMDFRLNFPRTQCFELSDSSREATTPLKTTIKAAIRDFCETSQPQDRAVLLFTGHAKGIDEKGYLVPIEGDLSDPETLVPIDWVYDQLAKCPARQKVFILDVCRFNPGRGYERPGSDPMDETLDKVLQNPPDGVQVWSSCVKDQKSYSFRTGSLFLEALCYAANERIDGIAQPNDLLPLNQLVPRVEKYVEDNLKRSKLKQTPRFVGHAPKSGADFDRSKPPPKTISFVLPELEGGIAGKAIVRSILDEINAAPPPRTGRPGGVDELRVSSLPPFSAKALDEYQKDGYTNEMDFLKPDLAKQFPLRVAILKAKIALKENANKFSMREYFAGGKSATIKKKILAEQEKPGRAIFYLEEALAEFEKAEPLLEKEKSKRWQAHYHLVMARLKSRLIYVHEYNYTLGEIRRDVLPELGEDNNGYRLTSQSRPSTSDENVREWRRELRRGWRTIISEFPGTPWELLARREGQTNLGLTWSPTRY